MTRTVFDARSVGTTSPETGSHKVPDGRRGFDWIYFIDGGSGATDVDLEWQVKPIGGAKFYPLDGASKANVDISGDKAYELDVGAVEAVQLEVTNNTAAGITVSAEADTSFR